MRSGVKDYGAVGDGMTDDTLALTTAFAAGEGFFPPGVYLSGSLVLPHGLTIQGANAVLKQKAGTAGPLLSVAPGNKAYCLDMTFDGNKNENPDGSYVLFVNGAVELQHCRILNAKTFGLFQAGDVLPSTVTDCEVRDCDFDGIAVVSAAQSRITGNRCLNNGRFGILVQAPDSHIVGNHCEGNGTIMAGGAGIGAVNAPRSSIIGNTSVGNTGHGVQLNGSPLSLEADNIAKNNSISGVDCYASENCTITGNISTANAVRGIEVDSASNGVTVSANIVLGNGEFGISVYRSQRVSVMGNSVSGNTGGQIRLWDDADTSPAHAALQGNIMSGNIGLLMENSSVAVLIGNDLAQCPSPVVNTSGTIIKCIGNVGFKLPATALSLQNGWAVYDAGWRAPEFRIDDTGTITLEGVIKNGTTSPGTTIATLPAGFRPSKVVGPFVTYSDSSIAAFFIMPNGAIVAQNTLSASRTSLHGIAFSVH
jgi:parallel beta-helix repeat protein